VGCGGAGAADCVQQHHPVVREKVAAGLEEGRVGAQADVLEHADRDDAVEGSACVAVVLELEADAAREAPLSGAEARARHLLLGEADAGDALDPRDVGEVEREPAPARADVEHPV
jgi:hypothetical protein